MAQLLPARHLVLRAVAKATEAEVVQTDIDDTVPLPDLGMMQLYSFYQPGLVAGPYSINVSQKVVFNGEEKTLAVQGETATTAKQKFRVVLPQFSIPKEDFHSTYPAQGHADQPSIVPHLVFNDPHLPWETPVKSDPNDDDNIIPWLALFPFDCNREKDSELRLNDDQLKDVRTALKLDAEKKPSATFTISTTVRDYLALEDRIKSLNTKVRIPAFKGDDNFQSIKDDPTPVEVMFIKGDLFKLLFYNKSGTPDVGPFRYCSHVRNINTQGITGAGVSEKGLFSIVHSKRSGPFDIAQGAAPRSQAVHLVSLENIETLTDVKDDELVSLVSLYRWTYLCQPPLSVNFIDAMRDIGIQLKLSQNVGLDEAERAAVTVQMRDTPPKSYLRCSEKVLAAFTPLKDKPDPLQGVKTAMAQRLSDGFSLVKYRVQSGEETVGLSRGALLPVYPSEPLESWPYSSNNGQDYQIFDRTLRIMDISYSSAFQLGRIMATSDIGFVSALMRIRTRAYQSGVMASSFVAGTQALNLKTKAQLFASLPGTFETMKALSTTSSEVSIGVDLRTRWDHSRSDLGETPQASADPEHFAAGVEKAIAAEGSAAGTNENLPISDLFAATSDDWRIVHDWVLDRMYLHGIPTHYFISDPNLLPPESMRFFHIDKNWMDCFIDGALSCANHTALNDNDVIREVMKAQFNKYLSTPIPKDPKDPSKGTINTPQIPIYGLLLRSAVVQAFKDLIVEAPFPEKFDSQGRAPILVQKRLSPDILMILLDRLPDSNEIASIKFTQPPHQQRFCAADYLSEKEATYLFRKLYYADGKPPGDFLQQFGDEVNFQPAQAKSVYNWTSRCIDFEKLDDLLFKETEHPNDKFAAFHTREWKPEQRKLTSAIVGIQLNDTMKYLEILPPDANPKAPKPKRPYQIRTRPVDQKRIAARGTLTSARAKPAGTTTTAAALVSSGDMPPVITPPQKLTVLPPSMLLTSLASRPTKEPEIFPTTTTSGSGSGSTGAPHPTPTTTPSAGPALPIHPAATLAAPTPPRPTPRISSPCFILTVYPRETPTSKSLLPFVWTDVPYAGDLIFSLQRIRTEAVLLNEIIVTIPLGPSRLRKKHPPTAPTPSNPSGQMGVNSIEGPGLAPVGHGGVRARMLSNQRWAVALDAGNAHLTVRLVARSMKRKEPLRANRECSFLLMGVDTGWTMDETGRKEGENEAGQVKIQVTEIYGDARPRDQGTASEFVMLTKKKGWKE